MEEELNDTIEYPEDDLLEEELESEEDLENFEPDWDEEE